MLDGYFQWNLLWIKKWSGQPRHSCGQAIETLSVHFIHDKTLYIKYTLFVWTNGKYVSRELSMMWLGFLKTSYILVVRRSDDLIIERNCSWNPKSLPHACIVFEWER